MGNVSRKIKRILDEKKIEYEISEHEPVYTSEQAAKVRGVDLKTGIKALVAKTKEGKYLMILVRADKRADLNKIACLEGTKKISLATPEEVIKVAGCEIGSVPPFGHPKEMKTYMDREILENNEVNFNIGEHTKSVKMKATDLVKVIDPVFF